MYNLFSHQKDVAVYTGTLGVLDDPILPDESDLPDVPACAEVHVDYGLQSR